MPEAVELQQMLDAREKRAFRQWELLQTYGVSLICFTMNIAGPIKDSPRIRDGFRLGLELLTGALDRSGLKPLFRERITEVTGSEAIFCLDADPLALKAVTADIEDRTPLGRLFDMDVIRPNGLKVDRAEVGRPERRCLICGGPARDCARSRTHSVAQLQETTFGMLEREVDRADAAEAAEAACRALLFEVSTTPKPGLVDRRNSGSHRDMDVFSFLSSSAALWPYFARCAEIGRQMRHEDPRDTFAALRWPGKEAEGRMLAVTGGVNTHKGAIFSMGVLCGALGRLDREDWRQPERVLAECAAMTKGLTEQDFAGVTPENAATVGQRLYALHGITGVRGQAEAGFPAVLQGLPVLEEGLRRGYGPDRSGCAALLTLLTAAADTNLIHRGGLEAQQAVCRRIAALLEQEPYPDPDTLAALDDDFIRKNLSPGGSADLLAVCYLLHFLR